MDEEVPLQLYNQYEDVTEEMDKERRRRKYK